MKKILEIIILSLLLSGNVYAKIDPKIKKIVSVITNNSDFKIKSLPTKDLKMINSSNWGWFYAYATRFPNHENIKRIEEWANEDNLNKYQKGFLYHYKNIGKTMFNDASWTVVEANCHFLK